MNTIRNESIIDYMIENKKSNCNIINPLTAFMLVKSWKYETIVTSLKKPGQMYKFNLTSMSSFR